ncbi:MAG: hypothetical protein EOP88_07435 [Verrucomicrobiaceae bacterium]|nr:MAG: hypothetical protein EOP88_07435 [Verrucomicrobiaceae bacterium]
MNFIRGLLCMLLFAAGPLVSAQTETQPVIPAETAAESTTKPKAELVPGVALSQGITEITGVAISPLLGVSAVGAWRYWQTPHASRDRLPWYAQPWAWGTGLALLSLCFLKDSLGTAVPGIFKKPLDMVELFEDKASALVASGAFVPLVANEMAKHLEAQRAISIPTASIGALGFTTVDAAWIMVPAAIVAFLVVWVCSHAINVLIVLSPFSSLDALLKLARTGLLLFVTLLYAVAPWLAAVLCLVIIAIAAWFAPAAMRLMIFGARYAADILFAWRSRKNITHDQPHAFTLGRIDGLPARTGGRLVLLEDGSLAFRYRRFCILDTRTIPLPDGRHHIEKGVLSPSLIYRAGEQDQRKLLLFLPRYRTHEQAIAKHLNLQGVREHAVARGFKAAKEWVKGLLRGGKRMMSNEL